MVSFSMHASKTHLKFKSEFSHLLTLKFGANGSANLKYKIEIESKVTMDFYDDIIMVGDMLQTDFPLLLITNNCKLVSKIVYTCIFNLSISFYHHRSS